MYKTRIQWLGLDVSCQCPDDTSDLENRVRFKIGLELRLELASKMISATLKYLPVVELL